MLYLLYCREFWQENYSSGIWEVLWMKQNFIYIFFPFFLILTRGHAHWFYFTYLFFYPYPRTFFYCFQRDREIELGETEMGRERKKERERETLMCKRKITSCLLLYIPTEGLSVKPGYVLWPRIKPVTLWSSRGVRPMAHGIHAAQDGYECGPTQKS